MESGGLSRIGSIEIQPGTEQSKEHRPLVKGQTVCTVKNEKGESCTGHVKQWNTAPKDVRSRAAQGNTIHRCQRCFAIYEGPPQEYLHPKIKK